VCQEFAAYCKPAVIDKVPTAQYKDVIAQWPSDKLGPLYARAKMFEGIVEDEVRKRLAAGQAVEGWELKPGTPRESVSNIMGVWEETAKAGVEKDKFLGACGISKAALKGLLKPVMPEATGKEIESKMDEILKGNTKTTPVSPSLVASKGKAALTIEV